MINLFNHELQSYLHWKAYRYRFLFNYICIGFLSLTIEIIVLRAMGKSIAPLLTQLLAASVGILIAFVLNVRFNFKVPKPKRNKAFLIFILISSLSFCLSLAVKQQLIKMDISYGLARFLSSGSLFFVGYILHRKFTFKEYKLVGVAVYAHGNEDIKGIWEKIKFVGDFIHIDIVDETFNEDAPDPTTYRLEAVRAYWPNKEIHCHIMSKTPSKWLDQVIDFADSIVVHYEIDEDLDEVLDSIKTRGIKAGICLLLATPVEVLKDYLYKLDEVMLLTIPQPGRSGQKFDVESLTRIEAINGFENRSDVIICIDGGVNDQTIHLLQVEKVISGSFVLDAPKPMQRIMRLQTSSQYEAF